MVHCVMYDILVVRVQGPSRKLARKREMYAFESLCMESSIKKHLRGHACVGGSDRLGRFESSFHLRLEKE